MFAAFDIVTFFCFFLVVYDAMTFYSAYTIHYLPFIFTYNIIAIFTLKLPWWKNLQAANSVHQPQQTRMQMVLRDAAFKVADVGTTAQE